MSSTSTSELNDADCEKGQVSQRPPISYATSKDDAPIKASRETIKMKTPEGEVKVAVLGEAQDQKSTYSTSAPSSECWKGERSLMTC
jgi:hypothetical protein